MIRIEKLTLTYRSLWRRGSVRALDALSLPIEPGSATGLVGLNGAGKTTLLRLLLGYLHPTSGTVTIGGLPPRSYVERFGIAYVPERVAIPRHWTVDNALRAYALLGNVGTEFPERIEIALRELDLEDVRSKRVGDLSKGNLQRLAIAQAVLYDRKLMILDEPTDALDPLRIADLRSLIRQWRSSDPERVVLVASHNLPFLEQVTDRVIVLHRGRLAGELSTAAAGVPLEEAFLRIIREGARAA